MTFTISWQEEYLKWSTLISNLTDNGYKNVNDSKPILMPASLIWVSTSSSLIVGVFLSVCLTFLSISEVNVLHVRVTFYMFFLYFSEIYKFVKSCTIEQRKCIIVIEKKLVLIYSVLEIRVLVYLKEHEQCTRF